MSKSWRIARLVTTYQAQFEPEDARRCQRLVSLLATGIERLLYQERNIPESVDFEARLLPNTCTAEGTAKTESK